MVCRFGFTDPDLRLHVNPLHDVTPTEPTQVPPSGNILKLYVGTKLLFAKIWIYHLTVTLRIYALYRGIVIKWVYTNSFYVFLNKSLKTTLNIYVQQE